MGLTNDVERPAPATPGRPVDADRSEPGRARDDRLVELHVLAEHGDPDAAARAAEWLAADAVAYRTWHEVEQTCQEIRRGS